MVLKKKKKNSLLHKISSSTSCTFVMLSMINGPPVLLWHHRLFPCISDFPWDSFMPQDAVFPCPTLARGTKGPCHSSIATKGNFHKQLMLPYRGERLRESGSRKPRETCIQTIYQEHLSWHETTLGSCSRLAESTHTKSKKKL